MVKLVYRASGNCRKHKIHWEMEHKCGGSVATTLRGKCYSTTPVLLRTGASVYPGQCVVRDTRCFFLKGVHNFYMYTSSICTALCLPCIHSPNMKGCITQMRRGFLYVLFALFFFGGAVLVLPACAGAETIVLATGEWAPFTGSALPENGMATKVVRDAFAASGYQVEIVILPWKRVMQRARDGGVAGAFLWRKSKEREAAFLFSEPVMLAEIVLFYRESSEFSWSSIDDLTAFSLGGVLGLSYTEEFVRRETAGTLAVTRVPTQTQAFQALLWRRVDAVPAVKQSGYHTIGSTFFPAQRALLTHHPKPLALHPLHLVVPRTRPDAQLLVEKFNAGLALLKKKALERTYIFPHAFPLYRETAK